MAESDDTALISGDHFVTTLGMQVVSATADEVIVEWEVDARHLQPFGIVHGGTYCGAIETACSVGAVIAARAREPGVTAVGLENHTSFIRSVRSGTLRAVARPLTRGRRTHVWEAEVRSDDGRLAATGRVRLLVVPADRDRD